MIRILQIYDHLGINCGIMSVIMNWYRHVDTNEIQFDFLVAERRDDSHEAEIRKLGGHVYYMGESLSVFQMFDIIRNTKKFMKSNARKYAAVHLHSHAFAYPYLYYARKYGCEKRISHAHSISLGNSVISSVRNRLMIYPIKFLANIHLACSEKAGKCLYNTIGIKNFDIILNGIDFDKYKYNLEKRFQMRKELRIDENELAVIHVSNMNPIKNVPFVVETVSKIKSMCKCKLILVGKNDIPDEVVKAIQAYNIEYDVINLGVRSDVPELLQAADVCLMPSKSEGLGIVTIECQAAGLPVITSLGFPEDVYVTDIIKRVTLQSQVWAETAVELAAKRTFQIDLRNASAVYDIRSITKRIIQYYEKEVVL